MHRTKLLIPVLLPVLAWTACGGNETTRAPQSPPAVSARIEAVAPAPVSDGYEAVGTVRAKITSVLSSKVVGQVLNIRAQQGEHVRPGQILAEIDSRDVMTNVTKAKAGRSEAENALSEVEQSIRAADAARSAAEAAGSLAQSTYKRYQALLQRKSVSQQEFEEVEFRYKNAEAEVRRAEQTLGSLEARKRQVQNKIEQAIAEVENAQIYVGYSRVTAPYAGIVTARHMEAGAMSAPGVPILTIEDNGSYQLEADVDESQVPRIKIGDNVRVIVEALGNDPIAAKVTEIVPAAEMGSRSFVVKLGLPRLEGVRSGMFGRALFSTRTREVVSVPDSAVVRKGQLTGVYVVNDKRQAHFRLIKTGKVYADRVEVVSGLANGERIVLENLERVQDGTPMTPL